MAPIDTNPPSAAQIQASRQDRSFAWNLFERFRTFYSGRWNEASVRTAYRASSKFSNQTATRWNRVRLPQRNFSVALAGLGANYSFSRFLTTGALIQLDTANTRAVSANFRLRYQFQQNDPFSNLFIIYNTGTRLASLSGSNLEQLREECFEVKLTYSFTPWPGRIRKAGQNRTVGE